MMTVAGSSPGHASPKPVIVYSRMWRSGTGLYAQGVARGLAEAGYAVTFIAPTGAPEDRAGLTPGVRRIMPPREYAEDVRVPSPARAWRSLQRIAIGLGALLTARRSSPRIVVTIPEPLLFWLPVLLLLRLTGAKVAFICHDPEPHAWRLPRRLHRLERAAHALSYRLAWRIVVLSTAGKSALEQRFGVAAAKIAVIPHGAFDVASAGPVSGNRQLLVFGTIRRNKGVARAIQAVGMVAAGGERVTLVVAGGPDANDPDYLDECRALAERVGSIVTMEAGYIADTRVDELLRDCDAMLLPYTDFESQSGVAVLAGMAGRPVICALAGGIPDLITGGLAAVPIADPVGTDEIAAAIRSYLAVPAESWSQRSADGRGRLADTLAWPRVGAQFGALFE